MASPRVKDLLTALCELDDVDAAPALLAPHLATLLASNVTAAAEELIYELTEGDPLLPSAEVAEAHSSIRSVADYVMTFIEEIATRAAAMSCAHQSLLQVIVESSTTPHRLDAIIAEHRHNMSGSFLAFLNGERKRLEALPATEASPLAVLLRSIEERVRYEVEVMTDEDVRAVAGLLESSRGSRGAEFEAAAKELMDGRNSFEARRLVAFLHALAAEVQNGSGKLGSSDLSALLDALFGPSGVLLRKPGSNSE